MFDKYEFLTPEKAIDYVIYKEILVGDKEDFSAVELGDGNINYVTIVKNEKNKKSVVLKQSDKLLRSSGRPLSTDRSRIECNLLKHYEDYAPGFGPKIYGYDEILNLIVMEDISEYKNMREALMNNMKCDSFAEKITDFIVNVLLPTTDLYLDPKEKKEKVKAYINPDLCDISEDLVFTEPYKNYKDRNIITKGLEDFVELLLYSDETLHYEVSLLKEEFMNNAQGLIHGDLHMGSIFVTEDDIKVIDPEFGFYGPIGYDSGNVIGNLFFDLTYHDIYTKNEEMVKYLREQIIEVYDLLKLKLEKYFEENLVIDPLRNNKYYLKNYIQRIMEYTIGIAGLEIIRRVVGDSKVIELEDIKNLEIRRKVDRRLIRVAKNFVINRKKIIFGEELCRIYDEAEEICDEAK